MIDLKPEVFAALSTVLPAGQVFYAVPEDNAKTPCVSYFEQENAPDAFGDDTAYSEAVTFVVDVWGDTSAEITPIAQQIDAALFQLGFTRLSAVDIPDTDKTLHKSMQYSTSV